MKKEPQKIYLVRHGETAWSLSGQHTGITDIPLTEKGKEMAKVFKPFFANKELALVLTSPLKRAKMTCELAGLSKKAEIEPDLMEWNYGDYEGITAEQIHVSAPDWMVFKDGCPGGENPKQVSARVDKVIAKIRATDGDVALFAHGHILRALTARWLDLPVKVGANFLLDTGTLCILSYYKDLPAIERWNALL
jgi:broad specificity phosphatase PhoE